MLPIACFMVTVSKQPPSLILWEIEVQVYEGDLIQEKMVYVPEREIRKRKWGYSSFHIYIDYISQL